MKKEQRFSQSVKCYSPPVLRNVALIDAALSSSSSTIFEKCKEEYSVDVKCSDFSLYNNDDHCPPECKCTESTMTVDCRDRGLIRVPAIFPEYTVELDLSNNAIQDVAGEAFDGLHSLTSLLLNANRLQCLRRETFHDLPNLTLLSLYDNRIKSIGNGTFSSLGRLQTLHLAKNPIICDCNMLWLAEFLKRHPVETSGVRCESPKRVARKRFTSLEIHKFKCKGAAEELVTKYSGQCLIDTVCPDNCHCQDTVVDCGARNLHSIPKQLPSFTTHLLLNDNQIRALDSGVLEKLTNLRVVNLSRNRLTKIDHFSFKSTSKLEEIILSDNDLVDLDEKFFFGLDSLQRLFLRGNNFICNCHATWIPKFTQRRKFLTIDNPVCDAPANLRGKMIHEWDTKKIFCYKCKVTRAPNERSLKIGGSQTKV
uniref:Uncharacterized protein n=1 Tax=Romanomermis culicivorax TaxID=13658 RepID=A0A915L2R3_ROMCU